MRPAACSSVAGSGELHQVAVRRGTESRRRRRSRPSPRTRARRVLAEAVLELFDDLVLELEDLPAEPNSARTTSFCTSSYCVKTIARASASSSFSARSRRAASPSSSSCQPRLIASRSLLTVVSQHPVEAAGRLSSPAAIPERTLLEALHELATMPSTGRSPRTLSPVADRGEPERQAVVAGRHACFSSALTCREGRCGSRSRAARARPRRRSAAFSCGES